MLPQVERAQVCPWLRPSGHFLALVTALVGLLCGSAAEAATKSHKQAAPAAVVVKAKARALKGKQSGPQPSAPASKPALASAKLGTVGPHANVPTAKKHVANGGANSHASALRSGSTGRALERVAEPSPNREIPAALRALGPLSVGHPSTGYLINSVPMPRSEHWVLTAPDHGFATAETADALDHCLTVVHERNPEAEPTMLGSISAVRGGRIAPHKSHRTGRDADVYFFRKPGAHWNKAATEEDIDLGLTWQLLRCFVTDTDVDMILIDRRVQGWLSSYALSIGEPKAWIELLFHDRTEPRSMAVVRHEPGHVAHMHVRFSSPKARRAGVAAYDELVKAGLVQPKIQALSHVVRKGETLSGIAHKFGIAVDRIRALNGLKSNLIRTGQELALQRAVDIMGARDTVGVPARRRPPSSPTSPVAAGSVSEASEPVLPSAVTGAKGSSVTSSAVAAPSAAVQPVSAAAAPVQPGALRVLRSCETDVANVDAPTAPSAASATGALQSPATQTFCPPARVDKRTL